MAVISTGEIKDYLRIDEGENITLYAEAAEQYFLDAVGKEPDPENARDVMAVCAITQEFYDHRTFIASEPAKDRLRHVISSMLDHARLDMMGGDADEG